MMSLRLLGRATLSASALAFVFYSSLAFGEETEGARLFREGRELLLAGRFEEACPKLAESQRLEPHVGTLLNLAACHERQGKLASAWVEYQQSLTAARAEGQADRARLASERIAVIEPRVPFVRVVVPPDLPPSETIVTLDGAKLEPAAWGKEMPLDPDLHTIFVRVRGDTFEERFQLHEGEHKTVNVNLVLPRKEPEVIIEQPSNLLAPSSKDARDRGRWVLEVGAFVGYLRATSDQLRRPSGLAPLVIERPDGSQDTCGAQCEYVQTTAGGAAAGANVFGGYAFTDRAHVGVRFLGGPRVSGHGGSILLFGPAVSLRASSVVSFGAWAAFGTVTTRDNGNVNPPTPFTLRTPGPYVLEGDVTGFAVGGEISLRIAELERGSILAQAVPLFLAGSTGSAFSLPVGLVYHFE